jgi:hypothetical protein
MTKHNQKSEAEFLSTEAFSSWAPFPSAQTMFRCYLLDPQAEELISQAIAKVNPEIWERDREHAERIERAPTVEALLDLIPVASGTAEPAWHRRMRQFGPEVVPLVEAQLRRVRDIEDDHLRGLSYEHLLSALRWKGEAGAAALLSCFDDLNQYGKSLACVSLGQSDAQAAADIIWTSYESAKNSVRETHFVGALWGLIDLKDPRATDAVADLLWEGLYFYELFGFLSLCGNARAVIPLLLLSTIGGLRDEKIAQHAGMALLSIAHRIGRQALLDEFQKAGSQTARQQREREGMADDILATSPRRAEEYFALFYRGLTPEDIDLEDMKAWKQSAERELGAPPTDQARRTSSPPSPTPPARRPGRNDPCWCGSGKKYKHCHMRQERDQSE